MKCLTIRRLLAIWLEGTNNDCAKTTGVYDGGSAWGNVLHLILIFYNLWINILDIGSLTNEETDSADEGEDHYNELIVTRL